MHFECHALSRERSQYWFAGHYLLVGTCITVGVGLKIAIGLRACVANHSLGPPKYQVVS